MYRIRSLTHYFSFILGLSLTLPHIGLGQNIRNETKSEFYRCVGLKDTVALTDIPEGAINTEIRMWSTTGSDVDFRLSQIEEDGTLTPIIEAIRYQTYFPHENVKIFYTGYWGINGYSGTHGDRGNEIIKIRGTTLKEYKLAAYGYQGGCMKIKIKYKLNTEEHPDTVAAHTPICLRGETAHEGWYWSDTRELIEHAYCRNATPPTCSVWGPDYERWEATGWQNASGWPSESLMDSIHQEIAEVSCHREIGIAMGGESCGENFKCFEPYQLECRAGICTNDLIENEDGCLSNEDCARGFTCQGRTFNGLREVGRCTLPPSPEGADNTTCDNDDSCEGEGVRCSNWNVPGEWGMCTPSWMFFDSAEEKIEGETVFSSPRNIPIADAAQTGMAGQTTSYQFVTGLASVPMTALGTLIFEHTNPSDLTITAYAPAGASYAWDYEKILWDRQTAASGETRITLEDVVLAHTGDDMVNGFWSVKIVDHTPGNTGHLIRWDVKVSSRWD